MIPDNLIPLVYFVAVGAVGAGLHFIGLPPEMTALIVGAGLTRVKMPAPPSAPKNFPDQEKPE